MPLLVRLSKNKNFNTLFSAHAKEALDLAKMQENTKQIEYQVKVKVRDIF